MRSGQLEALQMQRFCVTLSPLALLLVLVATGCGSKGGPAFTLSPTEKCLNAAGYKAAPVKNPILTGTQGNLEVDFGYGTESIYLVFGKNASEATALQDKAVTQTEVNDHLDRTTILSGVTVDKNVFYYSDRGPLTVVGRNEISAGLSGASEGAVRGAPDMSRREPRAIEDRGGRDLHRSRARLRAAHAGNSAETQAPAPTS